MDAFISKPASMPLLAVLASPPLGTTGARTLARVEMAARHIGCDGYVVGNVFAQPTSDVLEISIAGATPNHWMSARIALEPLLARADNVLFAWGKTEPSGLARGFHRAQIAWVRHQVLIASGTIWMVGEEPRHPSRWQRFTSRNHPQLSFNDALGLALRVETADGPVAEIV